MGDFELGGSVVKIVSARFLDRRSREEFVHFEGGDGVWIFIDGRLAIDLGGMNSGMDQFVFLDRLGLADGEKYRFQLFYAERDPASSGFRLRTTLELETDISVPGVSAAFD